jgi:hypothetical protein
MIESIVLAIIVAVVVALLLLLIGRLLVSMASGVPALVAIGGFLAQYCWVIGLLAGILWFIGGDAFALPKR